MHLISVDLPAPLSPSSASTSPAWTSRSTPSSASDRAEALRRTPHREDRRVGSRSCVPRTRAAHAERGSRAHREGRPPRRRARSRGRSRSAGRRRRRCAGSARCGSRRSSSAPTRALPTLPRPPANAAPPMITAAIESSSASSPKVGDPDAVWLAVIRPPNARSEPAQHVDRDQHAVDRNRLSGGRLPGSRRRRRASDPRPSLVVSTSTDDREPEHDEERVRQPSDRARRARRRRPAYRESNVPSASQSASPRATLRVASVTMNGCGIRPHT